jgi:hypothetical protein
MAQWVDVSEAVSAIASLLEDLEEIVFDGPSLEVLERVRRWKTRAVDTVRTKVTDNEATSFHKISLRFDTNSIPSFESMIERHRSALIVLADELQRHPETVLGNLAVAASERPLKRVFFSHATSDRTLARTIREQILDLTEEPVEIFLSTRPGHIPAGKEWWLIIQRELKTADGYIVLLTPESVNRPWVVFEIGAAWMTGRRMLTVCTSDLDRDSLRMPLANFQVYSLEEPEEAESVLKLLGCRTESVEGFCATITAAATGDASGPWKGVAVGNRYFAWDGPRLHFLADLPGTPTPPELPTQLRTVGVSPRFGLKEHLTKSLANGMLQVFETDKRTFRRPLFGGGSTEDQILMVLPGNTD